MASSGGDSHLVIRAAFDVGSGKTKMDVCTVDVHRNVIVNTLYSEQIDVPFALDMLEGGAGGGGRVSMAPVAAVDGGPIPYQQHHRQNRYSHRFPVTSTRLCLRHDRQNHSLSLQQKLDCQPFVNHY